MVNAVDFTAAAVVSVVTVTDTAIVGAAIDSSCHAGAEQQVNECAEDVGVVSPAVDPQVTAEELLE